MSETDQIADSKPGYGAPAQLEMTPALRCLEGVSKVEIQEKVSLLEAATALLGQEIEMANKYKIFDSTEDGPGKEIFYAVEQTDFMRRNLKQCFPDCAPWDVHILYTAEGEQTIAFELKREWTCTCCCFNRPVVDVIESSSKVKIGSIKDPFACCNLTFALRDPSDNDVVRANGGCCQWGLCCPLPFGPCATVEFQLEDVRSGKPAGSMTKKVPSCLKWCFAGDVDNYKLDLEGVSEPQWKAMLLALAIFVDFRYFNDNSADES